MQPDEVLKQLVGRWEGFETLVPDKLKASTIIDTRLSPGRRFVMSDHTQRRPDGSVFFNHLIYAWYDVTKQFMLFQFDSSGRLPTAPTYGRWTGKQLIFDKAIANTRIRFVYDFPEADTYLFTLQQHDFTGQWQNQVVGRFHRIL